MTYCVSKISYAVYLVMAEETVCAPLCFLCDVWISSWYPADFHVTMLISEQTEKHTSLFHHIFFFPVSLFFSCLEKQNKQEFTRWPTTANLQHVCVLTRASFFNIHENMQMRGVSFNCRVSHVTRAEGSKGTRGGEAPVPQTRGVISTCSHLLWERDTLCIMETHWWVFLFS